MNKKGNNKDTIIKYLLLTFIIICSIFRYKTIYLDSSNILEASLSNILYPFTFIFIIMIYKTENFSNAHKTILKTSLIFIIFMIVISILNTIPGNYYSTEIDQALKQVLTPNFFIIKNHVFYYPNILNVISFTLLYYFSHTLVLILYEAMKEYTNHILAFNLAMFIPFTLDTMCFVIINDIFLNVEFNKLITDLTSNFIIVIIFTLINTLIYSIIYKKKSKI